MRYTVPTVGVEEEYQLVHPTTGELLPNCKEVMQTLRQSGGDAGDAEIQHELHLNQIEMASDVCDSLSSVQTTLEETRAMLSRAARQNGCELASSGTNPLAVPDGNSMTPKDRYLAMGDRFQQLAREMYIFGCHVHVAMEDRALGVKVMNRCRKWLPVLQAMTSNSPFWDGGDTGYASYRRELWAQWPMAGPPPNFDDLADYEKCVDQLTQCGAIKDESFIYWDIRLPSKVPTIEFRGADVMTRVEETVGYVGLVQAMVMQATAEELDSVPFQPIRPNVLSYAIWHAARYGLTDDLVDAQSCQKVPAMDLVLKTISVLGDALDAAGERQCVDDFVALLSRQGTGARRQRNAAEPDENLRDVIQHVVNETVNVQEPASKT